MIDIDKYVKFLTKHAPSTKKRIYVAETSSGRVQHELWDIAMSFLIEVERLSEIEQEHKLMVRVVNDLRCDLTMMRLDDNHQPQFEDAVRAATKTLSEVIDVD